MAIKMFGTASSTLLIEAGYTEFSFSAFEILGFTMIITVAIIVSYWGMEKLANIAMNRDIAFHKKAILNDTLRRAQNSIAANQIFNGELLDLGDKVQTTEFWSKM